MPVKGPSATMRAVRKMALRHGISVRERQCLSK